MWYLNDYDIVKFYSKNGGGYTFVYDAYTDWLKGISIWIKYNDETRQVWSQDDVDQFKIFLTINPGSYVVFGIEKTYHAITGTITVYKGDVTQYV